MKNYIDESITKAAEIMKALGHPTRIEIILLLSKSKNGKLHVKQIHENLGLTQPETSRYLTVMKNASVLSCEKDGSNSYYFINENHALIKCIVACINKNK